MNGAKVYGTVELLLGEGPADSKRARAIQEKMVGLSLGPLVVKDAEYNSAIYGRTLLEAAVVACEEVDALVVEVDAESAELVVSAREACRLANVYLAAVAMGEAGELMAGNFLPEQRPSPRFIVHLERRV